MNDYWWWGYTIRRALPRRALPVRQENSCQATLAHAMTSSPKAYLTPPGLIILTRVLPGSTARDSPLRIITLAVIMLPPAVVTPREGAPPGPSPLSVSSKTRPPRDRRPGRGPLLQPAPGHTHTARLLRRAQHPHISGAPVPQAARPPLTPTPHGRSTSFFTL